MANIKVFALGINFLKIKLSIQFRTLTSRLSSEFCVQYRILVHAILEPVIYWRAFITVRVSIYYFTLFTYSMHCVSSQVFIYFLSGLLYCSQTWSSQITSIWTSIGSNPPTPKQKFSCLHFGIIHLLPISDRTWLSSSVWCLSNFPNNASTNVSPTLIPAYYIGLDSNFNEIHVEMFSICLWSPLSAIHVLLLIINN